MLPECHRIDLTINTRNFLSFFLPPSHFYPVFSAKKSEKSTEIPPHSVKLVRRVSRTPTLPDKELTRWLSW